MNIITLAGFEGFIAEEAKKLQLQLAEDVAAEARTLAPVRTGKLRDSIEVTEDGDTVTVQATAPYAGYVELGTRHMAAEPFLTPALMHERGA